MQMMSSGIRWMGDGYILDSHPHPILLSKYGLSDQNALDFMNRLCMLVDNPQPSMSADERAILLSTLETAMNEYRGGELYHYLLYHHGAEAISLSLWTQFALKCNWDIVADVFLMMPSPILDAFDGLHWWIQRKWDAESDTQRQNILEHIAKRDDYWGSLPPEIASELLFGME